MKRGFTLVELSIVLVIIGLLIGGILVAQSMISTSKIQATVLQLQQFDIAFNNFKTNYNAIPGDNIIFDGTGRQGDNDGNIINGGETDHYWSDLSKGVGLKNTKGNSYVATSFSGGTATDINSPELRLDQDKAQPRVAWAGYGPYGLALDNWIIYSEYTNGATAGPPSFDPLKPTDVLALDKKLDDGMPATGIIWAETLGGGTIGTCRTGSNYNISATGYTCSVIIRINATTGIQK